MAHKYPNVLVHIVFSTTNRLDSIPAQIELKLWPYLGGIAKNHDIPLLIAGGTRNHAHLLIALPSDMTIAKIVQVMKANSSRWISQHGEKFSWQEGYGAFSVSPGNKNAVRSYIANQAVHHKKHNFDEEFRSMLKMAGMAE